MEKQARIGYIDLMKGICIILVVIHNGGPLRDVEAHYPLLNSLLVGRMPLYFFLSGLFFKTYGGFGAFATRKTCQLVVPTLVFGLLGGWALDCIPWTQWSYGNITNPARYGVYLATLRNDPLWFLRALFVGSLMAYGLRRLTGEGRRADLVGLAVTVVAGTGVYLFCVNILPGLPELAVKTVYRSGVFNALAMLQFLWLGMIAGKSGLLGMRRNARTCAVAALAGAAGLAVCLYVPGGDVSWCMLEFPAPWAQTLVCVAGMTMLVWAVAFLLQWLPLVSYFGRYSIVVLVTHYPLVNIIKDAFGLSPVWAVAASFAAMPAVIYACVHWMPWACAQKQLAEWRDGRLHPAPWLAARAARIKAYFM